MKPSAVIDERTAVPASIQPHGILLVLSEPALTIAQMSDNLESLLGIPALDACGATLAALMHKNDAVAFAARLREPQLNKLNPYELTLRGPAGRRLRVECTVRRRATGGFILELEPAPATTLLPVYTDLQAPIERMQAAPDVDSLLASAARDIRAISGFDRVLISRLENHWQGDVVAEAAASGLAARYLGQHFSALDVPASTRAFYLRSAMHVVPDTQYVPVSLISAEPLAPPIDLSHCALCGVPPLGLAGLSAMGSRAAFSISLTIRGRLWGVVTGHHPAQHRLGFAKRALCELLTHMLAWQLSARIDAGQQQRRARVNALLATTVTELAVHDDAGAALVGCAPQLFELFAADGIAVRIGGKLRRSGNAPRDDAIVNAVARTLTATATNGNRIASSHNLAAVMPHIFGTAGSPAGALCIGFGKSNEFLLLFRPEMIRTIVWGGAAATEYGAVRHEPSLGPWRQTLRDRCRRWTTDDAAAANALEAAVVARLTRRDSLRPAAALTASELDARTYARRLRGLTSIAGAATGPAAPHVDAALALGLQQLGMDDAFVAAIDGATRDFTIESSVNSGAGPVLTIGTRLTPDQRSIALAALVKRGAVVEDAPASVFVPLFIAGEDYGVLGFTSRAVPPRPLSSSNIEFAGVVADVVAGVIDRGLQRERIERARSRDRALIETIPQKMWVVDAANQFEYVNERWTQYTGLTLEASRAGGADGVFHAAELDAAGFGRPLPLADSEHELRLRRADGTYRWHLVRSVPFGTVAGSVDRWLVTATDIEARKSAETQLAGVHDAALAATQAKSRFLATMSHEIRTPMNGVIGMTELLLLTPLTDEQREYTEVVRESGHLLLRVLNDILDYSKIEAGKLELETVRFDLPGQVESVVELMRPGFTSKGVRLTTRISAELPGAVVGDPGRLRQILLNLTSNALKFTDAGGSVQIAVSPAPAGDGGFQARFAIDDTGIGMRPDVVGRLFQPFSQGDESTTRKYGGTGLGLSISAELVALMGGEIGVQSTAGVGSEFWFTIPLALPAEYGHVAEARERQPKRSEPARARAERVLLVEDNEINTFLALKQLQRLGFAVTAVTNGRQAVDAVAREQYDLAFMDCHMPTMDGFEATRAIRTAEGGTPRHLPIVAMTADARDEDHQNCLSAGMDDFISKPTNLDSLKAVLDRWLPAPERRRASRNVPAAPSSAPSSTPTLGMSMLLELFNGDRGTVFALLAAAVTSIQGDIKRIEEASAMSDFELVIEAAHRLKGTSGSIRAGRLVEIAATIEAQARTAPLSISPAALADLRAAAAAVAADVQRERKGPDFVGPPS